MTFEDGDPQGLEWQETALKTWLHILSKGFVMTGYFFPLINT